MTITITPFNQIIRISYSSSVKAQYIIVLKGTVVLSRPSIITWCRPIPTYACDPSDCIQD